MNNISEINYPHLTIILDVANIWKDEDLQTETKMNLLGMIAKYSAENALLEKDKNSISIKRYNELKERIKKQEQEVYKKYHYYKV